MPSLILSQIFWWLWPKFYWINHVVRKMTFRFSISTWKIQKTSKTLNDTISSIHHSNSFLETNNMKFIRNWNSKISNFGELFSFSPLWKLLIRILDISNTESIRNMICCLRNWSTKWTKKKTAYSQASPIETILKLTFYISIFRSLVSRTASLVASHLRGCYEYYYHEIQNQCTTNSNLRIFHSPNFLWRVFVILFINNS